jgi:ProP effector
VKTAPLRQRREPYQEMVSENDEAGAPAETGTAGQECSEGIPPNSTKKPDPASTIEVLAELFPAAFVADQQLSHRPLKVGIHQDLIHRSVLQEGECRAVFRFYTSRRSYQKALAAGGPRFDLDGNVAGEVTAEQQEFARTKLEQIKARMKARDKAKPKAPPTAKPEQLASPRLGLADLRAAATARKARLVDVGDPTQAAEGD